MNGDLVFKRVVPGTYAASMEGTDVTGHVVRMDGEGGWLINFTDGGCFIARTRVDARVACRAYLGNGHMPKDLFDVTPQ